MSKTWKVFWYEYTRHVFRKRFIFGVLAVPLMLVFIFGISIISAATQLDGRPAGFVDQATLLTLPPPKNQESSLFERPVHLVAFATPEEAQAALDDGTIQAYFILPPDYLSTARLTLVAKEEVDSGVQGQFQDYLELNLLSSQPAEVTQRVLEGSHITIETPDQSRQMGEGQIINALMPIFTGVIFMMVVFSTGGYLMQAVIEEKENRTMEIIVTSVSPDQLMTGKILGNLSVGLTQLIIWVLFILIGVQIGRQSVDWLDQISIGWDMLALMLGALIPTFVMIAGLMATIGATVTESREAQQITGLFTLPVMMPYWFAYSIMTNPGGPLAVGMSFFPLTSPVALTLRAAFTPIPTWQLAVNIAVLVICAAGSLWLAARAFRIGMLSYGKRIALKELFARPTRA